MRDERVRRLTRRALILAAAMILSWVESLLPPPVAIPGVKWGWANAAVVFLLLEGDPKGALVISLVRTLLSGLLFSGASSLMYSLPAALVSWGVMVLAGRVLSVVPASALGALAHNAVQAAVAALVAQTPGLLAMLPFLLAAALVTGVINGILARLCARVVPGPGKTGKPKERLPGEK